MVRRGVFDLGALADAIDAERVARGLTWKQVTDEVRPSPEAARPGEHPMSTSAISSMRRKRSANSAIVLQILLWLGRTPESFLAGNTASPRPDQVLPRREPGKVLRFDSRALHAAVEERKRERGLTWEEVAGEMRRVSASTLAGLARGTPIGFPQVMSVTQWVGRPAASFVRGFPR